jgi:hypothetical protein
VCSALWLSLFAEVVEDMFGLKVLDCNRRSYLQQALGLQRFEVQ